MSIEVWNFWGSMKIPFHWKRDPRFDHSRSGARSVDPRATGARHSVRHVRLGSRPGGSNRGGLTGRVIHPTLMMVYYMYIYIYLYAVITVNE